VFTARRGRPSSAARASSSAIAPERGTRAVDGDVRALRKRGRPRVWGAAPRLIVRPTPTTYGQPGAPRRELAGDRTAERLCAHVQRDARVACCTRRCACATADSVGYAWVSRRLSPGVFLRRNTVLRRTTAGESAACDGNSVHHVSVVVQRNKAGVRCRDVELARSIRT
jgi:hypothetical protein